MERGAPWPLSRRRSRQKSARSALHVTCGREDLTAECKGANCVPGADGGAVSLRAQECMLTMRVGMV